MEDNNETQDVLSDYEEKINARRIEKALKPIKTSRSVLFLVGLLVLIATIINVGSTGNYTGNIVNFVFIVVFLGLYFSSRYFPFISILSGAILYGGLTIYSLYQVVQISNPDFLSGMFSVSYVIFGLVRLVILFFLVRGAVYAKKYEELTTEA